MPNSNNTCPVCRAPFDPDEIKQPGGSVVSGNLSGRRRGVQRAAVPSPGAAGGAGAAGAAASHQSSSLSLWASE